MAKKKKVTFGTMCTCGARYAIAFIHTDNTLKWVTNIDFFTKTWQAEKQKPAFLFSDRVHAEDICLAMNANGCGCFVIAIPDYFNAEQFCNSSEDNGDE